MKPGIPRTGWRYIPAGKRDLRLDLLRGFAVFAMIADHVGGPSPLHVLTGGNRFFVSAAEAFVFISGVTVGIVYGALAKSDGFGAAARKALTRSWTLYAIAIWLGLACALGSALVGLPRGEPIRDGGWRFVLDLVTLQRTYYLVDVMLLYAFLLFLAPISLWLLLRRAWWAVLGGSWLLWAAYQVWPGALQLPWPIADNPVFNLAAWQVLAFTGLVLGYERDSVAALVRRLPRVRIPGGALTLLVLAFAALVWLHVTNGVALDRLDPARGGPGLLDSWFDKSALPPARLLACGIVFALAWCLVTRLWTPIRAVAGGMLLPLGQAALYAYSAHVVLILALGMALQAAGLRSLASGEEAMPPLAALLAQLGGLLLTLAATRDALGQKAVHWLGQSPIRWPRAGEAAARAPRIAPSLVAVAAISVIGLLGILAGSAGGRTDSALAAAPEGPEVVTGAIPDAGSARRTGHANPVTTVTAARSRGPQPVAKPAEPSGAASTGNADVSPTNTEAVTDAEAATGALVATVSVQGTGLPAAEPGTRHLDLDFYSPVLGRTMPMAVILPPGYEARNESYPVLYMLHGGGSDYLEWEYWGLAAAAESLMSSFEIPGMIIVLPAGEKSYWANGLTGEGERWADYVIDDVVAYVDAHFRTIPEARSRAVGGLSRGGFGALHLAFLHPDVFGVAGAHSPSLHDYASIPGILVSQGDFARYDPILLAESIDPARAPRLWIDIGDEDDWRGGAVILHNILNLRGIDHVMVGWEGGHSGDYWAAHVADYLRFYAGAFDLEASP